MLAILSILFLLYSLPLPQLYLSLLYSSLPISFSLTPFCPSPVPALGDQRAEDLTYAELSLPPSTQSTFSRSLSRSGCRAVVGSPPLTGPHEPPTEYADIDFVATRAHGMPSSPLAPSSSSPPSHGGGGASRGGTAVWVPPRTAFDSWPKYTIERPRSPVSRRSFFGCEKLDTLATAASHLHPPPRSSLASASLLARCWLITTGRLS